MQAAMVATATVATTLCSLFNYLVDGVSGKVGAAVGSKHWDLVAVRSRLSLACGLAAGCVGAAALALLEVPIRHLMRLQPEVVDHISSYWRLRSLLVPLTLLNMSLSGILQGYNLVSYNAAISVAQSLLDTIGTALVLHYRWTWYSGTLTGVGIVVLLNAAVACAAGTWCIMYFAPAEAHAVIPWRAAGSREVSAAADVPLPVIKQPEAEQPLLQAVEPAVAVDDSDDAMHLMDFLVSGWHMLVRSMLLQATFFLAATIAARLGTAALAAHAVVSQLWMLASFVVDGFAVAGTVLGSRLVAVLETSGTAAQDLRALTERLMLLAVGVGSLAMILFSTFKSRLIDLFTQDAETIAILQGPLWTVLAVAQPVNAAVFVLDGLLYATQSFPFVAAMMTAGFSLLFLPVLAWTQAEVHAVWGIWLAKVALNLGRLASASCWLYVKFLRTPETTLFEPL